MTKSGRPPTLVNALISMPSTSSIVIRLRLCGGRWCSELYAIYVIASCFGCSIIAVCPFHYRCRLSRKLDQLQILRDYFAKWKSIAFTHRKSHQNIVTLYMANIHCHDSYFVSVAGVAYGKTNRIHNRRIFSTSEWNIFSIRFNLPPHHRRYHQEPKKSETKWGNGTEVAFAGNV